MKLRYFLFIFSLILLTFFACKGDDGLLDPVEAKDRGEQQVIDKAELLEFLQTHYYNADEMMGNMNASIDDLKIEKLEEGESVPTGHKLLMEDVVTDYTTYEDVEYEYHFLMFNEGGGEKPKFSDQIRLIYSGSTTKKIDEVFDNAVNPVDFDLTGLIRGWSVIAPRFSVSETYVENGDGTVSFTNPGIGVMFLPSGLAYFNQVQSGIEAYDELFFKFEIYQLKTMDHDLDGVPSFIEDLNNNNDVFDDDTDGDEIRNYIDADDDGDGVATINELEPNTYIVDTNNGETEPMLGAKEYEISRTEEAGIITIKTVTIVDANNNNIDDYLDKDVTTNYNEED